MKIPISGNEGEFNLKYLPLQGNDEVGWDKFADEYSLSYVERLACQAWVRDHRDKVVTNPATILLNLSICHKSLVMEKAM